MKSLSKGAKGQMQRVALALKGGRGEFLKWSSCILFMSYFLDSLYFLSRFFSNIYFANTSTNMDPVC